MQEETRTNTWFNVERGCLLLPNSTTPLINSVQHSSNTQHTCMTLTRPLQHRQYHFCNSNTHTNLVTRIHVLDAHTQTDLGIVWLEMSFLSASPLFIFTLVQLLALLFRAALIGSEAARGVGFYVGLILQSSPGRKVKNQSDVIWAIS